jgi:hypothetical protein
MPDEKIAQVIVILEGIKSIMDNEIDEWDLKLIREAQEALKVGDFIPFEDVLKEAGLSVKDLQNSIWEESSQILQQSA